MRMRFHPVLTGFGICHKKGFCLPKPPPPGPHGDDDAAQRGAAIAALAAHPELISQNEALRLLGDATATGASGLPGADIPYFSPDDQCSACIKHAMQQLQQQFVKVRTPPSIATRARAAPTRPDLTDASRSPPPVGEIRVQVQREDPERGLRGLLRDGRQEAEAGLRDAPGGAEDLAGPAQAGGSDRMPAPGASSRASRSVSGFRARVAANTHRSIPVRALRASAPRPRTTWRSTSPVRDPGRRPSPPCEGGRWIRVVDATAAEPALARER